MVGGDLKPLPHAARGVGEEDMEYLIVGPILRILDHRVKNLNILDSSDLNLKFLKFETTFMVW